MSIINELLKIGGGANFEVTEENIELVNLILKKGDKKLAKIGNYVDFESGVLWSNSSMGYSPKGTDRICGLGG